MSKDEIADLKYNLTEGCRAVREIAINNYTDVTENNITFNWFSSPVSDVQAKIDPFSNSYWVYEDPYYPNDYAGKPYGSISYDTLNFDMKEDWALKNVLRRLGIEPGLLKPEVSEEVNQNISHPLKLKGGCEEWSSDEAVVNRCLGVPAANVGLYKHAEAYVFNGSEFISGEHAYISKVKNVSLERSVELYPNYLTDPESYLRIIRWYRFNPYGAPEGIVKPVNESGVLYNGAGFDWRILKE